MQLGLREASHKTGVGHRTLERWVAEGLTSRREKNRLLVDLEHVRAWKRWKSMRNVRHGKRRRVAAAGGVQGAHVTEAQYEKARRDWIATGGKETS